MAENRPIKDDFIRACGLTANALPYMAPFLAAIAPSTEEVAATVVGVVLAHSVLSGIKGMPPSEREEEPEA